MPGVMRYFVIAHLLLLAQPICGWGDVGHRTVGYLAQKYLTDQASQWVNDLLANDEGDDISDAATWADAVRHARPWSAGWHFIDAQDSPPSSCSVDLGRDCGNGCVISAITNHTSIVIGSAQPHDVRSEALKFLLHFIGDLHQPLHAENAYRGGNEIAPICFDNRCSNENLHGIWDTDIIHKLRGLKHTEKHNQERDAASQWADELFQKSQFRTEDECADIQDPEKCTLQWVTESNQLNCDFVLVNSVEWLKSANLGGEYYEGAAPIVATQIGRAGVRLGAWLNALAAASAADGIFTVQPGNGDRNVEL